MALWSLCNSAADQGKPTVDAEQASGERARQDKHGKGDGPHPLPMSRTLGPAGKKRSLVVPKISLLSSQQELS